MAISQLPQAPFRQDRKIFPTPIIGDVLFSEIRDCNRILIPEYGTPHPDTNKWPDHKLIYVKPVDIERNEIFEFFYAADRENQDLYNFEVARLRVGTLSVPMVKRTYLSPRESFDLTEPQLGSAMPNIPLDKFEAGYILHEVNQVRAESELDSLFVREEHIYILPLSTISRATEDQDYVILESHVGEADAPDTYTGVVESSVMAIGNGKAVKTTKVAITDFNEDNDTYDVGFSELRGVLFDPRYGIRVEIERNRVDPDSAIGVNPIEENGVVRATSRDPDSIRQSRQETRSYTLPEDQVWYGSRRAPNLPRVLDRIEILDVEQNPTLVPIFEPLYDGVLPARWTRKFTFGPPAGDFVGRVYRPEEFVFISEYERKSESRSTSRSLSTSTNTGTSTSDSSGTSISTNTGLSTSSSSGSSNSSNVGSSTSSGSSASTSLNYGYQSSAGSSGSSSTTDNFTHTDKATDDNGVAIVSEKNIDSNSTSESISSSGSSSNSSGNNFSSNSGSSTSDSSGNSTSSSTGSSTSNSSGNSTSSNSGSSSSHSSGSSTSANSGASSSDTSGSSSSDSSSHSISDSSGNSTSDNSGSSTSFSVSSSTSENTGSSTSENSGTSTSENTGSSTSASNSDSTSESTSVSFGLSVLSLQIPACLRRRITVNLSVLGIGIDIPATVPTTVEHDQWVIEDISSNHWQDGIWVTEMVEVYLGAL